MALELIPTSKSPLGSDIPEHRVSPSNDTPDQVKDDWERPALGIQDNAVSFQLLDVDWALKCPN